MAVEISPRMIIEEVAEGWSLPLFDASGRYLLKNPMIREDFSTLVKSREWGRNGPNRRDKSFLSQINVRYADAPMFENKSEEGEDDEEKKEQKEKTQIVSVPDDIPNMIIECPESVRILPEYGIHPGGMSKYIAEYRKGDDIAMISSLEPNGLTADFHYHLPDLPDKYKLEIPKTPGEIPGIELYKIVYGMAIMHYEEGDQGFAMPKYFAVEPGIVHRMEAGPKGAIFAIIMKNAALYPPELRHIRFPLLQAA